MNPRAVFSSIKAKSASDNILNTDVFKAAQAGDSESFGQLYNAYFDKIYRFIYYRTSHQQTAEDLAEEVFIKAFKGLADVAGGVEKFQGWLYTIARNTVIDHYRSKNSTAPLDELDTLPDYNSQTVVETLALQADQQRLQAAIQALPAEQQAVIQMRFLEELTISEIAELLGKSEGNVRIIQFRALKKLRTLLLPVT